MPFTINRWCLLLLLATAKNAAAAKDELSEIRAALAALSESHTALSESHIALSESYTALSESHTALSESHTALSARLRAIEKPATMADPADAAIPGHDLAANSAHRLTSTDDSAYGNNTRRPRRLDSASGKASINYDGTTLSITSPLDVDGEVSGVSVTASGAISGASMAASGAVSGSTITDGTATISGGAISSTTVSASGTITSSTITDGTATISGGVISSASMSGDLDVSGYVKSTAVAFSAYSTDSWAPAAPAQMAFAGAILNEGAAYSTTSSTFTAPVAGLYHFTSNCDANGYCTQMQFTKNGAAQVPGATACVQFGALSIAQTFLLSAGDAIGVTNSGSNGVFPRDLYQTYATCGFGGHLVTAT